MFYFNHTLHVSLMHNRELALKAGGYDEDVTVLIDWNMTRKLSFYTDFKYVPEVTGEYFLAFGNSDRISDLERKDKERYKHNLRKIRADLPPGPWPKVDKIAVILQVSVWTDKIREIITGLSDHLYYPVRFVIVNNDIEKDISFCKKALGIVGELRNIEICTPKKPLGILESYKYGAKCADADYIYIPSDAVKLDFEFRLMLGRDYLSGTKIVKWDLEQERDSPYDVLIEKEYFLQLGNLEEEKKTAIEIENGSLPESKLTNKFQSLKFYCQYC